MRAGELNRQITLQYPTRVPNGTGGYTLSWVDNATLWAAIWPVSATEQVKGQAEIMLISHRIQIRYRRVLKADWRICYGDRFFNIVSITDPDMAHEYLEILCKEASN